MPRDPLALDYSLFGKTATKDPLALDVSLFPKSQNVSDPLALDYSLFNQDDSNAYSPRYDSDQLDDMFARIQERSKNIELEPSPPKGVLSSLGRGLAEGLLGPLYDAPGPGESATFQEELSYSLGQIGGSVPMFLGLSAVTGGAGVPAAGVRTVSAITKLRKLGRTSSKLNKESKICLTSV